MKKWIFALILMLAFPISVKANPWCTGWDVELRAANFYPSSELFRKIYKNPRWCYQLEVSRYIWNDIYAWANIETFSKSGHSLGLKNKTHIRLIPVSLGLKYLFRLNRCIGLYVGAGVSCTDIKVRNHSEFVIKREHKHEFGWVLKSGIRLEPVRCIILDGFVDYYSTQVHFRHHHAKVGGLRVGVGIGRHF